MKDTASAKQVAKNQLLWRCRVGTRELELLLYRYIDRHYTSLSAAEIETFQEFIQLSHEQLNAWLLSNETIHVNNKYHSIIKAVKEFD